MLYHQNRLAQVKLGSTMRASSQILGDCTKWFDCLQNFTSHSSRKYHPLPTMPCSFGSLPVRYEDWTEQVTAGRISSISVVVRALAHACSSGMRCKSFVVSPTTLITARRLLITLIVHPDGRSPTDIRARSNQEGQASVPAEGHPTCRSRFRGE